MAGFCRNCGAEVEDDARVCGKCGVPISPGESGPKLNIPKMGDINPQTKEKAKKIGIAVGAGIAALIVIIIVAKIVIANTGYRATLNKFFKGLEKGNAAAMTSCLSDYLIDWGDNYSGNDMESIMDDYIDNILDHWEDEVGANPKFKYEIKKDSKLSDRKIEKLQEMIENIDDDYDVDSIKAARNLDLKLTIKGRDDTDSETFNDVCMVKENGKWKIIAFPGYGLVP